MILVEKILTKKERINSAKIYINTLTPHFQFKNKLGRIVLPIKRCICL